MFQSKRWMLVSAVGYGVMFSLALTGLVRIAYRLCGTSLSPHVAGNLFLVSSLVAGSLSGYLYVRSLNQAKQKAAAAEPLGDPD